MENDEVKRYHFAREYRKGFVHKEETEKEPIQNRRQKLLEKIPIVRNLIKEFQSREYLTEKIKETIEMAEEFVKQCERKYGEQFEKLYREEDVKKAKKLEEVATRIIQDLKQYKIKEFVGENGVSQYIKSKNKDTSQALEHEGIVMMESSDFGNMKTVIRDNFYLDMPIEKNVEEQQEAPEQEER